MQTILTTFAFISLRYDSMLVRRAATDAYLKSRDATALATFVCSMLRKPQASDGQEESKDQAADIAGPILKEIYNSAPK